MTVTLTTDPHHSPLTTHHSPLNLHPNPKQEGSEQAAQQEQWAAYCEANNKFADTVAAVARSEDVVWVHDYHLMLLPSMLRERLPRLRIGWFLHTPWPSSEARRMHMHVHVACSASCLHVYAHKGHWAAQRVLTHHSAPSANELALLQTHARRVSAVLIPIYRCAPCTAIAKHPPATSGVNRSGRANPTQISVWSIGSRSL